MFTYYLFVHVIKKLVFPAEEVHIAPETDDDMLNQSWIIKKKYDFSQINLQIAIIEGRIRKILQLVS